MTENDVNSLDAQCREKLQSIIAKALKYPVNEEDLHPQFSDTILPLASYLMSRGVERQASIQDKQAAILDDMKNDSKVIKRWTKALAFLTVLLLIFTVGLGYYASRLDKVVDELRDIAWEMKAANVEPSNGQHSLGHTDKAIKGSDK